MKEWRKRFAAIGLVFVLFFTMLPTNYDIAMQNYEQQLQPEGVAMQTTGESTLNLSDIKIQINGKELTADTKLKDGDLLDIDFSWNLDNTDKTTTEFTVDLQSSAQNIIIQALDSQALYIQGKQVATLSVDEKGILKISFTKEFVEDYDERSGTAGVHGKLTIDTTRVKDGDPILVGVSGKTYSVIYDANVAESDVDVAKQLSGNVQKIGDQYYQDFKVAITARNGEAIIASVSDVLETTNGYNTTPDTAVFQVGTDTYTGIRALNNALQGRILQKDETITITYRLEVNESVRYDGGSGNRYHNRFITDYRTNKSNEKSKSADTWSLTYMGPNVTKGIQKNGDKIQSMITIDLRAEFDASKTSIRDYVTAIEDVIPSDCVVWGSIDKNVDLDRFQHQGNGVFTYTFETPLDQTVIDGLTNATTIKNQATVKWKDPDRRDTTVTSNGITVGTTRQWISKQCDLTDTAEPYLAWKVTLNQVPDGITDVALKESTASVYQAGYEGGQHTLDLTDKDLQMTISKGTAQGNYTIVKNGALTVDGSKYFDSLDLSWDGFRLVWKDTFTTAVAGADVTFLLYSKISDQTDGRYYNNKATIEYKQNGVQTSQSADAGWKNANALSKNASLISNRYDIKYQIKVDLTKGVDVTKAFTLTDTFPKGLSLKGEIQATYQDLWNQKSIDGSAEVSVTKNGDQYTCLLSSAQQKECQTALANSEKRYVVLEYTLTVTDQKKFTLDNKDVTFDNTVTGSQDGRSIGTATASTTVKPLQVISKDGTAIKGDYASSVRFSVDVNPSALKLSDDDTIIGTDHLSTDSGMNYNLDSVKVLDVEKNVELKKDVDYSYSLNAAKDCLTFILPNEKHLKITYTAVIDSNVKMLNASNTFEIKGMNSDAAKDEKIFTNVDVEPRYSITGKNTTITLYKYWTDDGTMVALDGSKFEIYPTKYVNGKYEKDESDPNAKKKVTVEADTGKVSVTVKSNQVYVMYEVEAKEGFYCNTQPYFFYVKGDTQFTPQPTTQTIKDFSNDSVLEYPNELQLTICKKIIGDVTKEQAANLAFTVQNKTTGQTIGSYRLRDFKKNSSDNTYSLNLPVPTKGTYIVKESNTEIEGYNCLKTEVKADQGVSQAAEQVEIAIDDKANSQVIFTNTYEEKITNYVKFHKYADGADEELSGAQMSLYEGSQATGTPILTWVTGGTPQSIEIGTEDGQLKVGQTYTLHETVSPSGYAYAKDIVFKVADADGNLQKVSGDGDITKRSVIMRDHPLVLYVSKMELTGNKELAGAKMRIENAADGTLVDEWTSTTDSHLVTKEKLVPGTVYRLTETAAPKGYEVTGIIYFHVDKDGAFAIDYGAAATDSKNPAEMLKNDARGGYQLIVRDAEQEETTTEDKTTTQVTTETTTQTTTETTTGTTTETTTQITTETTTSVTTEKTTTEKTATETSTDKRTTHSKKTGDASPVFALVWMMLLSLGCSICLWSHKKQ